MATKLEIEKLNRKKFFPWKPKITTILRKDNCLPAIEGRPTRLADDKWKKMDDNAVTKLHLALVDLVLSSVAKKKMEKEICDALVKLYEVKFLHNRIFLKKRLYSLQMSKSTSMIDHINNLNMIFSQLKESDHIIAKNERAELLLTSQIIILSII